MNLSKRLRVVLQYIKEYQCLADVGSDHAHLAIAAAKQYDMVAYAIDNKNGPYQKALLNVNNEKVNHQVTCLLQDGLTRCPIDADIIAICGMGGLLMKDILDRHDSSHPITTHDLVLQPNNHVYVIRKWLMEHQYFIAEETMVEERGKTYEIIVAKHTNNHIVYSSEELQFGPILMKEKNEKFIKKYTAKLELKKKALQHIHLDNFTEINNIKDEITILERVLYED